MAATLISNYNVNQFVGYIVPTWYGKGGWGTLGLWQHLGGRYSLAEAWFFNNQVITHELKTRYPKSADAACRSPKRATAWTRTASSPACPTRTKLACYGTETWWPFTATRPCA